MALKGEKIAAYKQMKLELQAFHRLDTPKPRRATKRIFEVVLRTTKLTVELFDDEIHSICSMAGRLFIEGDETTQAMTFDFMKNLIDVFNYQRSPHLNGIKSETFGTLLMFYFSVVFRYASRPALYTKASQHALEHMGITHPYRLRALEAFTMALFADYPIERFEKKAVKNLLSIAKEKMLCHRNYDPLMPGTIIFLNKVCENQNSCGFVIRVCHVLRNLFQQIALSQARNNFLLLRGSPVFFWILSHVSLFRDKKKCWAAVAEFIKVTFLVADAGTKNILTDLEIFPRIYEMFRVHTTEVRIQLLEAVEAACAGPELRYINHIVNHNIFLRILPLVEDGFSPSVVRLRACRAFGEFLRTAPAHEVYRAAENGMAAALLKLLRSRHELAVINGLKWLFIMIEDFQVAKNRALSEKFGRLVTSADGASAFREILSHRNGNIRRAAGIINARLREPILHKTPNVAALEREEHRFIHETLTTPHVGLTRTF